MSMYKKHIEQRLKALKLEADPRHVEAYMRVEHHTLDNLSPVQFTKEIKIAVACIKEDGIANAEALAKSYGL